MMIRFFAIVVLLQATICLAFSPSQRSRPLTFNWAVSEYHPIRSPVDVLQNARDAERSRNHNGPSLRAQLGEGQLGEGQLGESFSKFDKDMSGGLDAYELKEALNYLDYDVSLPTALSLMSEFDADGNDQLDAKEFTDLVTSKAPRDVCDVFNTFANDEGFLVTGSLRKALSLLCIDRDSQESREILRNFDTNDDGRLGLLGFAELVSKLPVAKFWLAADPSGKIRKVRSRILKKFMAAPKKKVSIHSMLSTISSGLVLLAWFQIWSPGVNEYGIFQFTDQFRPKSTVEENIIKIAAVACASVATTGQFRIPANAPPVRRLIFANSMYLVLGCTALLLSSIGGLSSYMFDAWSWWGRLAIYTPMIGAFATAFQLMDDSIAGPTKGRDTVPMMGSRPSSFITSIFLMTAGYFQLFQLSAPLMTSKAVASTWNTGINISALLFGGVSASCIWTVVPTLKLENRIGIKRSIAIVLSVFLVSGLYDGYRMSFVLYDIFKDCPSFLDTSKQIMALLNGSGINQFMVGGTLLTVLNAIRRKRKGSSEDLEKYIEMTH